MNITTVKVSIVFFPFTCSHLPALFVFLCMTPNSKTDPLGETLQNIHIERCWVGMASGWGLHKTHISRDLLNFLGSKCIIFK